MLDIIRKKAASLVVKIIFGAIIIFFTFYFGYNRMSSKYGGKNIVAEVNGAHVTRPEYQLAYENQYKMYQQIFQGQKELSPEIEKSVRMNTVNQLIRQKVIEKIGISMGLKPTAVELADNIKTSDVAKGDNGKFDPYLYKYRILPYYAQTFNIDYEYLVENDLLTGKTMDIFVLGNKTPAAEPFYYIEKSSWNFEVSEFDNEVDAKSRKNGRKNKYGDITIGNAAQLFQGEAPIEAYSMVLSLAKGETLKEPIQVNDKWYIIKAVDVKKPAGFEKEKDEFAKRLSQGHGQEMFQEWVQSVLSSSKTKTFIE